MFKVFIIYNSENLALYIGIAENTEEISVLYIQRMLRYKGTDLNVVEYVKDLDFNKAKEVELECYNSLISTNPNLQRSTAYVENIRNKWSVIKDKITDFYQDNIDEKINEDNYFVRLAEIENLFKQWKKDLPKRYNKTNQVSYWKGKTIPEYMKMKISTSSKAQNWRHTKWKSEQMRKRNLKLKGKTYEEIYGKEKADKIRAKFSATIKSKKNKKK
jgi:hypothetical protein